MFQPFRMLKFISLYQNILPMETHHATESTRALCMRPLLKTGLSSRLIPTPDVARITHILTVLSICSGQWASINKL